MGYGVDIGSTAVKVVDVRRTFAGYKMVGAARRRVAKATDKVVLVRAVSEALGPRNGQRAGVVGLTGRDINLQIIQQPAMKPQNYRAMMGYELDQRRGEATDLYLDYCTLREPDPYFPQYLALIGIGKSTYVDDRIDLLVKSGLDVRDAVPNSFALFTAYRSSYDPEPGTVLLLDIGSDNMDLAFVRAGRLIFARNVSSGARQFDTQIAGSTGCSPEDAEGMKVASANLGPSASPEDEEREDAIRGPVRSAAGQLSGFITSSINHMKMQLNDKELAVDKVYLSGGGARVRGLPEYLASSLKMPVEVLDPFRKVDVSAVVQMGGDSITTLPTDMAVALGLAQLVSPPAGSTSISILPMSLRKRRDFFQTNLWMGIAGGVLVATLLVLTALGLIRKSRQTTLLEEFTQQTREINGRMDEMEALERDQRETASKSDYLLSHLAGGRVLLDSVARLQKALPPEIRLRDMTMGDPETKRGARATRDEEGTRVAFTARRRGLVVGEIDTESDQELRIKGQGESFRDEDIVDGIKQGVVRWPAFGRVLKLRGEIDDTIRGGPAEALRTLCDQLGDASRGVKASLPSVKAGDKPGWRQFELLITFE